MRADFSKGSHYSFLFLFFSVVTNFKAHYEPLGHPWRSSGYDFMLPMQGAQVPGSIPGQGTKIPHASQHNQKKSS